MQRSEGEQTQQGTRWTALETTNHNPRWGVSLLPTRMLNYSSVFRWASQEKNSPGKISIPLGHFPLLWYKGIEKHLFVLSCYCVLDLVFCTQQVLSNLLLVLTMWGPCFTRFTEEKTKCSERLSNLSKGHTVYERWSWDPISERKHVLTWPTSPHEDVRDVGALWSLLFWPTCKYSQFPE